MEIADTILVNVPLSLVTFAKLAYCASDKQQSIEDLASLFLEEGVNTCSFIFPKGVNTHDYPDITPDVLIAAESEEELPYGE